jgi:acyl carrier protein
MSNSETLMKALSAVLNEPVSRIRDESTQDTLPNWDSLAMVNLVPELEQAFGVEFDILEIADFKSVALIKTILSEKGVHFD